MAAWTTTQTAGFWSFWPYREDITLRVRTALPGTYTDHAMTATDGAAKRRALNSREKGNTAGVYTGGELVWLLPDANLPSGVTPAIGDLIQDAGGTDYTILSVDLNRWRQTYKCQTVSLALANGLTETGTLTRPTNAQDDAGRQTLATYTTIGTSACRVQPVDSTVGQVMDRRTMPRRHTAFLATALAARAKDRFVAGGVTYTVTALRNPERIDELQTLDLEVVL